MNVRAYKKQIRKRWKHERGRLHDYSAFQAKLFGEVIRESMFADIFFEESPIEKHFKQHPGYHRLVAKLAS